MVQKFDGKPSRQTSKKTTNSDVCLEGLPSILWTNFKKSCEKNRWQALETNVQKNNRFGRLSRGLAIDLFRNFFKNWSKKSMASLRDKRPKKQPIQTFVSRACYRFFFATFLNFGPKNRRQALETNVQKNNPYGRLSRGLAADFVCNLLKKLPQSFPKAAPELPQSCPRASPKLPQSFFKASPEMPQSFPKASPKRSQIQDRSEIIKF